MKDLAAKETTMTALSGQRPLTATLAIVGGLFLIGLIFRNVLPSWPVIKVIALVMFDLLPRGLWLAAATIALLWVTIITRLWRG